MNMSLLHEFSLEKFNLFLKICNVLKELFHVTQNILYSTPHSILKVFYFFIQAKPTVSVSHQCDLVCVLFGDQLSASYKLFTLLVELLIIEFIEASRQLEGLDECIVVGVFVTLPLTPNYLLIMFTLFDSP